MNLRDETSGADLLRRVRGIEIRTRRTVSEAFAGQFRSAFRGRGMEFEEVRPYQVGERMIGCSSPRGRGSSRRSTT